MGRHSGVPGNRPEVDAAGPESGCGSGAWFRESRKPHDNLGGFSFETDSLDPDDTCVWTFGPFLVDVPLPDEDQT